MNKMGEEFLLSPPPWGRMKLGGGFLITYLRIKKW